MRPYLEKQPQSIKLKIINKQTNKQKQAHKPILFSSQFDKTKPGLSCCMSPGSQDGSSSFLGSHQPFCDLCCPHLKPSQTRQGQDRTGQARLTLGVKRGADVGVPGGNPVGPACLLRGPLLATSPGEGEGGGLPTPTLTTCSCIILKMSPTLLKPLFCKKCG